MKIKNISFFMMLVGTFGVANGANKTIYILNFEGTDAVSLVGATNFIDLYEAAKHAAKRTAPVPIKHPIFARNGKSEAITSDNDLEKLPRYCQLIVKEDSLNIKPAKR